MRAERRDALDRLAALSFSATGKDKDRIVVMQRYRGRVADWRRRPPLS
jgi:hypothetical protein